MDKLSKLERKIILMESNALEAEEKLRKSMQLLEIQTEFADEPEMTIEEYDKQITAQLRIMNPELFAKNIEVEDCEAQENEDYNIEDNQEIEEPKVQINYEGYDPVEEQPQDDEEDS